jgi:ATP-binding cassette subfamily C (CFTR/MRP) protein 1
MSQPFDLISINHNILNASFLIQHRIMVLDKGKIIEFDSPKNLLDNTKGVFYSMAASAGVI